MAYHNTSVDCSAEPISEAIYTQVAQSNFVILSTDGCQL